MEITRFMTFAELENHPRKTKRRISDTECSFDLRPSKVTNCAEEHKVPQHKSTQNQLAKGAAVACAVPLCARSLHTKESFSASQWEPHVQSAGMQKTFGAKSFQLKCHICQTFLCDVLFPFCSALVERSFQASKETLFY